MSEVINKKTRLNKSIRDKIIVNLKEAMDNSSELVADRKKVKIMLTETAREYQSMIPKNVRDFLLDNHYVRVTKQVNLFRFAEHYYLGRSLHGEHSDKAEQLKRLEEIDFFVQMEERSNDEGEVYQRFVRIAPREMVTNPEGGVDMSRFRSLSSEFTSFRFHRDIPDIIMDYGLLINVNSGYGGPSDDFADYFFGADERFFAFFELLRKEAAQQETQIKLVDSARRILESCRTVGSLMKQWPEVEPYLPEYREDIENAPSVMAQSISQANAILAEINSKQAQQPVEA